MEPGEKPTLNQKLDAFLFENRKVIVLLSAIYDAVSDLQSQHDVKNIDDALTLISIASDIANNNAAELDDILNNVD